MPVREEGGTDEHLNYIKKEHGAEMAAKARKLLSSLGIGDFPEELAPGIELYEKEGQQAEATSEHVGGLWWGARGTGPDSATATRSFAAR